MTAPMTGRELLFWDSDAPIQTEMKIVFWQAFLGSSAKRNAVSLSEYVEINSDRIRLALLEFVAEVGRRQVRGRSIVDRLTIDPMPSYFWSTQFQSKLYTERAGLHSAARLMAFHEILAEQTPSVLVIATQCPLLGRAAAEVARASGVPVVRFTRPPGRSYGIRRSRRLKMALPRFALAMVTLFRVIWIRLWLGGPRVSIRSAQSIDLALFSYWYRFTPPSPSDGTFVSPYWGSLPVVLRELDRRPLWCHQMVSHSFALPLWRIRRDLGALNESRTSGIHCILESFLDVSTALGAVRSYWRLRRAARHLVNNPHVFELEGLGTALSHLFLQEWDHSLRGIEAMRSCLNNRLMSRVIDQTQSDADILYLYEGQPWEFALLGTRRSSPRRFIAVAHSTIRYWDLRFYPAPSELQVQAGGQRLRADLVAVNSSTAARAMTDLGYSRREVVEVEALMYESLRAVSTAGHVQGAVKRLLVAPDFLGHAARRQLDLLRAALELGELPIDIQIKPHWSNDIAGWFSGAVILDGERPLSDYLSTCDLLYVSNITSACLDAAVLGIPVVQCADPGQFDLSPLRGHPMIQVVRTPEELFNILASPDVKPAVPTRDLLNLDPSLGRWRSLLEATEMQTL